MNSEVSKASDPHRLLPKLSDRINLKRRDKYVPLSNLSIYYTWKNIKKSYKKKRARVLYTFVPNKSFGQLLDNSLKNFIFLKNFNID